MKRIIFIVCIFCYVLSYSYAFAEEFSLKDAGKIILGATASYGVHELGHQIVGEATGDVNWVGGKWRYEGKNVKTTAMSGFVFQGAGSEILMAATNRDNKFLVGYVGFNIINNLSYVVKTELGIGTGRVDGYVANDLMNFENKSQRRIVEAIVVAHAGWLTYRLLTDKDFRTWIGIGVVSGTPVVKLSLNF
jgi:hypothetical protein